MYRVDEALDAGTAPISLRCPSCDQNGTFDVVGMRLKIQPANVFASMYRCPNPECRELLFAITNPGANTVLQAFPPELIDFDSTNVPPDAGRNRVEATF